MPPDGPRRLGFDAIRAVRNGTGLGNYAREVLRGLHEHDRDTRLHLYSPAPPRPPFAGLDAELGATLTLPRGPWRLPVLRSLYRTTRLGRAAHRDGVDLYHGLSHEIPRDLPSTGIPSVVTFLDLLFHQRPELFPLIDRRSYQWRYRWSAEHADHIVAISTQTSRDLSDCFGIDPARISVVPPAVNPRFGNAVDLETRRSARLAHGIPEEFLLSVGTLEPRKNLPVLLGAIAALNPSSTPPLVLVGRDGGSAALLRSRIDALGLGDRVMMAGTVAPEQLPALMQEARALLYPSLAEGFGLPIIEGLAAGTMVIAADTSASREAGGSAAVYVTHDDVTGFAEAIAGVLTDESDDRIAMGRAHARAFDRRALAATLSGIYDDVIARRSSVRQLARKAV